MSKSCIELNHFRIDGSNDWFKAFESIESKVDIYFSPRYLSLHEANGEGRASAVLVRKNDSLLYVPYLLCPIPKQNESYYDVQGAYGYGGPIALNANTSFLNEGWKLIDAFWRQQGIIAAFFRLHPLENNDAYLGQQWDVVFDRETVSVNLSSGSKAAFHGSAHSNHRNMVSRAERLGFSCHSSPTTAAGLHEFAAMYWMTMETLRASQYYFFSEAYFARLARELSVSSSLFEVIDTSSKKTIAMACVLWGPRWAHYHLSARMPEAENCATNLLLQKVAEEASTRGMEALHLGGGRSSRPDDSLLRFKQKIGAERHRFLTARKVLNHDIYSKLNKQWMAKNEGMRPSWFLGYRQPKLEIS